MKIKMPGTLVLLLMVAVHMGHSPIRAEENAHAKQNGAPLIASIQGPALFHAYCASCHGVDAKGNGPMAASLKVKPSDLTMIPIRKGGVFPKEHIERIISGEELPPAGHGSSMMPVWGPIFSQVDNDRDMGRVRIDNLTRYLMSIQTK